MEVSSTATSRPKRKAAEVTKQKTKEIYTPTTEKLKREPVKKSETSEKTAVSEKNFFSEKKNVLEKKKVPEVKKTKLKLKMEDGEEEDMEDETQEMDSEEERETEKEIGEDQESEKAHPKKRRKVEVRPEAKVLKTKMEDGKELDTSFVGEPVPVEEAKLLWPHRYLEKGAISLEDDLTIQAKCHYRIAKVDDHIYNLNDDAYVKAEEGMEDYICRIVEFFEGVDKNLWFTAQWFFRAEDTVIEEYARLLDAKRVFLSDDKTDNELATLVKKIKIVRVTPNADLSIKESITDCDLYYDMSFSVAYSSFCSLPPDEPKSTIDATSTKLPGFSSEKLERKEMHLLDLYSGCGAMSTGLSFGTNLYNVNIKTCWAVDMNKSACQSLKFNHPETQVRNEKAEDFLALLHQWDRLVKQYCAEDESSGLSDSCVVDDEPEDSSDLEPEEFEVNEIIDICYGTYDIEGEKKEGLRYKVSWKGYGSESDSWEPAEGLSECQEKIKQFVVNGCRNNILPLPGTVDIICGGPPCQGASGHNRFRKVDDPFKDEKNGQVTVFMNIVEFLKPKYVLMENVVDILKFANGCLGKYALCRLVKMHYQARLGILAAGNYGLPQYRMRVFLWGAKPNEILPQLPLPTHDAVVKGGPPVKFETHVVAYERGLKKTLKKALLLTDAISDLPEVENDESRDEMAYQKPPETEFQSYIRLSREAMAGSFSKTKNHSQIDVLYDHRPLKLNIDDYQRVCRIPKFKGANFRHLPGVYVGPDNVVHWDPNVERELLPSGKQLIPDYAMSFVKGKSSKPFGRLWWDETVSTVLARAEPHNQRIIHPLQDRVLTVRENARIQGFPDHYKLFGLIKARYTQVGNAVAFPVSRALGYGLAKAALRDVNDDEPVFALPQDFPVNLQPC